MSAQRSPLLGPGEHFVVAPDVVARAQRGQAHDEAERRNLADLFHEARASLVRIGTAHELAGDRTVLANALTILGHRAGIK